MEALIKLILASSFYASIAGLAILALKAVLKDRISPRWHYLIWIVLIIKLLIPFGPQSVVSLFNIVPAVTEHAGLSENNLLTQPVLANAAQGQGKTVVETNTEPSFTDIAELSAAYLWLAGAIAMAGWLLYSYIALSRKLRNVGHPAPERVSMILDGCRKKTDVKKEIEIIVQDVIQNPAIFGLFKPRILLSASVLDLNDEEISYILLHELAHYKRRDLLANHLLLLLQGLHWFNPLLWYCFKRIRQDMELAADEKVLSLLEDEEQKAYGKALLSVLERFSSPSLAPRLVCMADDKKNIEKRIKMIKMADVFKKKKWVVLAVGILCIAGLSAMLLTNAKDVPAAKNSLTYINEEYGFAITFPESWEGKSTVRLGEDTVSIHHKALLESQPEGGFGTLFTIHIYSPKSKWETEGKELAEMTGMRQIGESNDAIFAVRMPTDVQYTQDMTDSYHSMEKDVDSVLKTFTITGQTVNREKKPAAPTTIEQAVSTAIKSRSEGYMIGEYLAEGHMIFETEEKDGKTIAYTVASIGWYGFENGIFTKVSGSGAIPTVITFSKNPSGEYVLLEYNEPQDGSGYGESLRKMFPRRLVAKAASQENYKSLAKQEEEQAAGYLKQIGRQAEVHENHGERPLANIDVQASNKLFSEYQKDHPELHGFPYWLGTRETIENNTRYVYETSQGKTDDGYDLITFRKSKADGTVVNEYKYKIVGSEPQRIKPGN